MTEAPPGSDGRLAAVLRDCGSAVIAVSGGVDSMSLSSFAHRTLGSDRIRMVHAVSPAVPTAATDRVRRQAIHEGWSLRLVDAGEFADERYRANPVDRCFFCKSNLYSALSRLSDGLVLSGTNTDDLGDYRPGLAAAEELGVRHPFVEAGFAKSDVRALARRLGLPDLAALPASPCLSSRVETGIRIEADTLQLIDDIETWLRDRLEPETVRCRLRPQGFFVELDAATLQALGSEGRVRLIRGARSRFPELAGRAFAVEAYRRGSAFVGDKQVVNG
ncbi:adenine nucleotide alpha hydrolase [Microbaculum marinum]|uniref:Adenine nucleotide alpha hydrolase n=1 Tax=Microbaculum marinum TaxID=1764581 RepID=A0AAW9RVE3_9HYPH